MAEKTFERYLKQSLSREVQPERLDETINICKEIMSRQKIFREEPRTSFWGYLSDVFRFEGMSIFGLQAAVLFMVCLTISTMIDIANFLPIYTPIFVLAVIPTFYKGQYYRMSEIEAATRASAAQIMLAKLILSGAANLICITVLLGLVVYLQGSADALGQMVLYCLVPYLVYMSALLRVIRLHKGKSIPVYAVSVSGSCICWGMSAKLLPWLYETSAIGVWVIVFLVFALFYINEIHFIIEMRKRGKMYGIVD